MIRCATTYVLMIFVASLSACTTAPKQAPLPHPVPAPVYQCWDGTVVYDANECPAQPVATKTCWDGSNIPATDTCPSMPPTYTCWDGTLVYDLEQCPIRSSPRASPLPYSSIIKGDYPADQRELDIILGPEPKPAEKLSGRLNSCQNQVYSTPYTSKFACVSLLYGTNRSAQRRGDFFYGNAPLPIGNKTILGELVVTVPHEHQSGNDISGALGFVDNDELELRENAFAIWGGSKGLVELNKTQFIALTRHRNKRLRPTEKMGFVFVHGFNVSFQSAAYNTAQLKTDLQIKGPAFFYSWPSNATLKQYIHDQDDADISSDNLADFLLTVREAVGNDIQLNIIAHSMGNRILGQALDKIKANNRRSKPMFDVGIFASADLDEGLFEKWVVGKKHEAYAHNRLVKRGVIYVTDDDFALGLSKEMRQSNCTDGDYKYRVGLVTKKDCDGQRRASIFYGPFETVDLSQEPGEKVFKIFGKNHNKYTKSPKIICHLRRLFKTDLPIKNDRPPFFDTQQQSGDTYWVSQSNINVNWMEDCGPFPEADDPIFISALSADAYAGN